MLSNKNKINDNISNEIDDKDPKARKILSRYPLVANPFWAYIYILYPLKTLENAMLCGVYRGFKIRTLAR